MTFGLYYNDTDRAAMSHYHDSRGLGGAYTAGTVTGTVAAVAATAVVTGGASAVTAGVGAGRVAMGIASAVRATASASMLGMSGYTGVEAGMAIGDVMNGGEWTADTTLKVGAFGLGMAGAGAGRMMGAASALLKTAKVAAL
jgi:hypothetical protein